MLEKECDQILNIISKDSVGQHSISLLQARGDVNMPSDTLENVAAILIKDGYADSQSDIVPTLQNHTKMKITPQGKYFINILGGYQAQMIRQAEIQDQKEYEERRLKGIEIHQSQMATLQTDYIRRSFWVNVGIMTATSIAGVYYVLEILRVHWGVCPTYLKMVSLLLLLCSGIGWIIWYMSPRQRQRR